MCRFYDCWCLNLQFVTPNSPIKSVLLSIFRALRWSKMGPLGRCRIPYYIYLLAVWVVFLAFEVDESPLRSAEESAWAVVDAVVVGYDLVAAA